LQGGDAFVKQWSVIPAEIVCGRRRFTIMTAMFMHAGWIHIVGNRVFLWTFGRKSKRRWGGRRLYRSQPGRQWRDCGC
jgi:membrane associated rhomboid family serine protease